MTGPEISRRRPRWVMPALAVGAGFIAWAVWVAATGGFLIRVGGLRVSSSNGERPFLFGGMLLAAALTHQFAPRFPAVLARYPRLPAVIALAGAAAALALGALYGGFVAGGPDPYGYVSQAGRWIAGTIVDVAPLSSQTPWFNGAWAFTPLGYRPALQPGYMVPVYPPGLPLTMAAAQSLAGDAGTYAVVPLLGALSVWLTFVLGRRLAGPTAGLIAAAALLVSPIFLLQLALPMSDVPVTAWWLLASVLALRRDLPSLALSGLAAAAAVLTRPNLAPLGLMVAVLAVHPGADGRERWRRFASWGAAALVGPIATALMQYRLYGSPFASGYGDLSFLYASRYAWANVRHYVSWLWTDQTAFVAIGAFAVPLLRRRGRASEAWLAAWALTFALAVAASYLWYLPFDDPASLRFLLPALPMRLATAAATLTLVVDPRKADLKVRLYDPDRVPDRVTGPVSGQVPGPSPGPDRVPDRDRDPNRDQDQDQERDRDQIRDRAWLQPIAAAAMVLVLWTGWTHADPMFTVAHGMARYRVAGEWARRLPADAIVISNLHSGSVRHYGGRLTLRYEWIGPDQYEGVLTFLRAQQRPAYAILDREEMEAFAVMYAGADLSWLRAVPLAILEGRVYVFSVPLTPGSGS